MQVVRWLVLAVVVVAGASIQVHRGPLALATAPAAELSRTGPLLARSDFLSPAELTGRERLAGAQVLVQQAPSAVTVQRPKAVPRPSGEIQLLIWNTFAPLGPDA